MATTEKYQGYSNYETFLMMEVGIKNERETQDFWLARASEQWQEPSRTPDAVLSRSEAARFSLADELREHFESASPAESGNVSGVWADLLSAAFSEIDWDDIADWLLKYNDQSEREAGTGGYETR